MGSSAENGTVHAPQGQPWLTRKAWAGNRIRSHKRWEVIILWGFALAWSALSMPLAYVQIPKALARGETLVACIIGVMLVVAVGLLIGAIRTTRDARRFGDVALQLDPFPGSIGGHFGATTVLPVAYRPGLLFAATLACLHHSTRRTTDADNDNNTEVRENVLWQSEGMAQVRPQGDGIALSFRLDVPPGLPPSEPTQGDHHAWRLTLESRSDPPLAFVRHFDVPVYATGEASQRLVADAVQHPAAVQSRKARLDEVVHLERTPGGVDLYLPYGRTWQKNLLWLVFGVTFGGFGLLAGRLGAPLLFPLVFGGVGGAFTVWAIFALGNSLKVQFSPQGLRTERRLLGFMFAWHSVPAQVEAATLQSHKPSKGGTAHSIAIRYRYQVGGVEYTGSRASLTTRADNIGSFQEQLGHRLQGAERTGEPVTVWVNPAQPTESIVDRSLRPGLLALQLGLALAFGGFGGHLLVRMGRTMWVRLRAQPPG